MDNFGQLGSILWTILGMNYIKIDLIQGKIQFVESIFMLFMLKFAF